MKLKTIIDVANWRLCVGCGACAYACPDSQIELIDILDEGIRPALKSNAEYGSLGESLEVCPGYDTTHAPFDNIPGLIPELKKSWGPVLELWEGHAADPDIRYNGSSGGLTTALALYCLEKEGMHGVLHTGDDPVHPWKNRTVMSRNHADLLAGTGSRYAPASPCDGLARIESAPSQCVFIGKPCDIVGLRKAQVLRPELRNKVGAAIGFFCAGTPSTLGTLDLLKRNNIDPLDVEEIRYRGRGWPGHFTVRLKGESSPSTKLTYMESWGFLQKYRPYRCYLCPDSTAEFADIACGDPWYREIKEDKSGYSLVAARTEKGRQILNGAIEAGYVVLEPALPNLIQDSQTGLFAKRSAIWGRLITMKAFSVPSPRLGGFSLFRNWCCSPFREKARSILGTARRIIQREYYRPAR